MAVDHELVAALIALDAVPHAQGTPPLLDCERRELDAYEADRLRGVLSTGEKALLDIARLCWSGTDPHVGDTLLDLCGRSEEAKRALTALAMRLGLCDYGPVTLDPEEYLADDEPPRLTALPSG